ncbi:MAG: hypothetical protein HYT79_11075 [Elusimicrobia bacterium]|nr:hypothetical protein [Elusimicrobiota bacterium]
MRRNIIASLTAALLAAGGSLCAQTPPEADHEQAVEIFDRANSPSTTPAPVNTAGPAANPDQIRPAAGQTPANAARSASVAAQASAAGPLKEKSNGRTIRLVGFFSGMGLALVGIMLAGPFGLVALGSGLAALGGGIALGVTIASINQ